MNSIQIGSFTISENSRPMVIAEISGNHNGSLSRALELLEIAKQSGADAVKIQTYTADTMTIDCDLPDFKVNGGLWDGKTLYELYQWAHTPWDWHQALFEKAKELDIILFSSPFDETAVDLLESYDVPAYKIASFEMTDLPLVERVAKTGKPIIVSTGMACLEEIEDVVKTVRNTGNNQLVLLHCVSSYPAKHSEYNLKTLVDLRERFDVITGLSDHSLTNVTSIASVALGASVVEKHFTFSRKEAGPDCAFSLEPQELKQLCTDLKIAWEAVGKVNYQLTNGEEQSKGFRRSIYAVSDIKKGDVFNPENIRRIRPGFGLAPKYYPQLIGNVAAIDIKRGTPINDSMVVN